MLGRGKSKVVLEREVNGLKMGNMIRNHPPVKYTTKTCVVLPGHQLTTKDFMHIARDIFQDVNYKYLVCSPAQGQTLRDSLEAEGLLHPDPVKPSTFRIDGLKTDPKFSAPKDLFASQIIQTGDVEPNQECCVWGPAEYDGVIGMKTSTHGSLLQRVVAEAYMSASSTAPTRAIDVMNAIHSWLHDPEDSKTPHHVVFADDDERFEFMSAILGVLSQESTTYIHLDGSIWRFSNTSGSTAVVEVELLTSGQIEIRRIAPAQGTEEVQSTFAFSPASDEGEQADDDKFDVTATIGAPVGDPPPPTNDTKRDQATTGDGV
jgi:hypothetical protein